jgi:amino acid adenylation domain-containing protein
MTTPPPQAGETLLADEALIRLGDGGPLDPGGEVLAHVRFERMARANPGLTAVVTQGETLTYGELAARADGIAAALRRAGVGREAVVGICLPRRLDVLVAVLGVLKAGAAYLPLDLGQPLERRRFMLADAGASALVTVPAWEPELSGGALVVVTPADGERQDTGDSPVAEPAAPGDLAYIIYTSGSTGQPKGVMIEHRSLAAYVHWGVSTFTRKELGCVLMATSFGFDMSIFEFLVPLSAGGRIVLVDNLFEIRQFEDEGLTLVNAVPSLMAALLRSGVTLPSTVRTAVFCGETLPFEVSEEVHRQPGIERVVNTYGPTEDTVYSTSVDVPRGSRPTIGRPFPGTQAYVVDEALRLVPRGEHGELCLGGVGLARGYRGRDELTRERFVPNPFPDTGSERLYRTGDLARWEDDGSLQHLGRVDHQIKLRGVRIEPGDIEEALLRHAAVEQAVVVARDRPAGGKWLVAYVVCGPGDCPDGRELREMLRDSLPKPMIPSAFVELAELPLNANGKLDRAQLPEPPTSLPGSSPLTETENALAEIWRDLLGLEALPGPDDDYFELGGDSLTAFEVFDRIETHSGQSLSPNILLEASSLAALAAFVDSGEERGRLIKLHPGGHHIPAVYVHSGAGGMPTVRALSDALGPDQPLYGIQAYEDPDIQHGHSRTVTEAAAECLVALRDAQPEGPYILAGHSIGGHVAFEMATRLVAAGETVLLLGLLDPSAPHTARWKGRVAARALQLIGRAPQHRRVRVHSAVWSALARRLRARRTSVAPQLDPDSDVWMRTLGEIEKAYRPPRYSGRVVTYATVDGAVYTGSWTLGWERYVNGPIEGRRVEGDHLSMLRAVPSVLCADIRAAQSASARGWGAGSR